MARDETGLRVLVVEDNPADARLVQLALEESDIPFAVHTVTTLEEGLAAAEEGVAVAVLDLNLPDSSGLETAKRFRAQCPDVPVVVVTGTSDKELGVQALRLGVHEYIAKNSMDGELLERRLMIAMERARMQAQPAAAAGGLESVSFRRGVLDVARADILGDRGGGWVVVSLATPLGRLRKQVQALGPPAGGTFLVAVDEHARTELGWATLAKEHGWEDTAVAIEQACRRLGSDAAVVVDSWQAMLDRYGADGAAELVTNLAYRFLVLGVQGFILVEEGTKLAMARPL